jgi:hypothetical protein
MWSFVLLLVAVLLGTGCATLRVDVDVYSKPLPVWARNARAFAAQILADTAYEPQKREEAYRRLSSQTRNTVIRQNTQALRSAPGQKEPEKTAERLWDPIQGHLDEAWQPVKAKADAVLAAAKDLNMALVEPSGKVSGTRETPPAPSSVSPEVFFTALQAAQTEHKIALDAFLQQFYNAFLSAQIPSQTGDQKAVRAEWERLARGSRDKAELELGGPSNPGIAASADVTGRLVGYPIFNENIGGLDRKNEDAWVNFGSSIFRTKGGSSQFVVVREGLVVFRQKSLDFDPTPVIGAGTAVTRLGLQVAAAVASGSTAQKKTAAPESSGDAGKQATDQTTKQVLLDEAQATANKELLAERRQAKKEVLLGLATLLQKTQDAVAGNITDDQLKALRAELESLVSHYQGRVTKPEGGQ